MVLVTVLVLVLTACGRDGEGAAARRVEPGTRPADGSAERRNQVIADAADKLGVTVEALIDALETSLDLNGTANRLELSVRNFQQTLTEALGSPPDLAAAAKKLGITPEKIRQAIGSSLTGFGSRDGRSGG